MHRYFETKSPPPCSGSLKDPTDRYIKNLQTHPKASLRRKGSGAGRNFNRKVSKSNTLPIQISSTLIETLGGKTSVGLWFRSLLVSIEGIALEHFSAAPQADINSSTFSHL